MVVAAVHRHITYNLFLSLPLLLDTVLTARDSTKCWRIQFCNHAVNAYQGQRLNAGGHV